MHGLSNNIEVTQPLELVQACYNTYAIELKLKYPLEFASDVMHDTHRLMQILFSFFSAAHVSVNKIDVSNEMCRDAFIQQIMWFYEWKERHIVAVKTKRKKKTRENNLHHDSVDTHQHNHHSEFVRVNDQSQIFFFFCATQSEF